MTTAWPRPDFLARPPRRPAIVWWFSGASLLAAALSVGDWRAATRELESQRDRLSRVERHAPVAASAPPHATASVAPIAQADAIRAARHIVDRIEHPWDRILANVESETPQGLQWLEMDHDADTAAVHLEGNAADVAAVLRLVDSLSARPGWSQVALARLRSSAAGGSATASPPWRFEVIAAIDARSIARARPAGEH